MKMANRYTGSDTGKSGLEVTEVDGAPNVRGVSKIIVSNTTLTDDGAGTVTIDTSGGGGGTPGGSNTQIQYNNAGAFAGNAGLTFAEGSGTLTATILTDGTSQLTAGALTGLTTPLTVAQGGTGASSITDGGIVLGSGPAAVTATSQPADGELLIGSGGSDPVLATLTDGGGVTATEGAGTITLGTDTILQDLDAIGAPTADGEFIVATGAGAFAYETAATALLSLGVVYGRHTEVVGAGSPLTTVVVADSAVTATNTILYSIEVDNVLFWMVNTPDFMSGRTNGIDFTITCDFTNATPGALNVYVNYAIIG